MVIAIQFKQGFRHALVIVRLGGHEADQKGV
jgi:hypothetical protein